MTKSFLLHSPTYSLQGIEGAAESLEQLWISYNQIDRMKPIRALQRLKVLYMSHNYVREWREFDHMAELPALEGIRTRSEFLTELLWSQNSISCSN